MKQFSKGNIVKVRVSGDTEKAKVTKANAKTVWVELTNGDVIKRHIEKHNVQLHVGMFNKK